MCERPIRPHRIDLAYCYRCRTFRGWSLLGTSISMQKRLNRSRCHLEWDSCGPMGAGLWLLTNLNVDERTSSLKLLGYACRSYRMIYQNGSWNHVLGGLHSWAIWYIKCTTGRFVCGSDAALCQIILTTYSAANRLRGFLSSRSRCRRQIIYAVYLLYICDLWQTKYRHIIDFPSRQREVRFNRTKIPVSKLPQEPFVKHS